MEPNPFTPPSELADEATALAPPARGSLKLYTAQHVMMATFIGTPLAGFWLIASNYGALGKAAARRNTMIAGIVATVALLALATVLPEKTPNTLLPVLYTLAMRQLALSLQGKDITTYTTSGGKHSAWRAAGIGVLCLLAVCAVIFGALLLLG